MGKVVVLVILAAVGYAWYEGLIFTPRKKPQAVQAADPLADLTARLKAEQARLHAEEDARGKASLPSASPALSSGPSREQWQLDAARRMACSQAQSNVRELQEAAQSGAHVVEFRREGGARTFGPAGIPAALAENQRAVQENCQ